MKRKGSNPLPMGCKPAPPPSPPQPFANMLRELEQTLRKAAIIDPRYLRLAERAAKQAERIEARAKSEPQS